MPQGLSRWCLNLVLQQPLLSGLIMGSLFTSDFFVSFLIWIWWNIHFTVIKFPAYQTILKLYTCDDSWVMCTIFYNNHLIKIWMRRKKIHSEIWMTNHEWNGPHPPGDQRHGGPNQVIARHGESLLLSGGLTKSRVKYVFLSLHEI